MTVNTTTSPKFLKQKKKKSIFKELQEFSIQT